jgi:hypothetical protein
MLKHDLKTKRNCCVMALALSLSFTFSAHANSDKYTTTKACGTAKIVSGDTCTNAQVRFDFENCPIQFEPTTVASTCDGKNLKARATRADYRFEVKFKGSDDGWGAVTWTQENIKTWVKTTEDDKKARTVSQESTTVSTQEAQKIKVSAFVDVRHTTFKSDDSTIKEDENSGYLLEDGAVYFSYADGPLSAFIDLPFYRNGDSTTDSADISFAKLKAQFYAKYEIAKNFNIVFGQFDTIYGVELNDSKDRVFGHAGLVYAQTLPVVHSGAYLEYLHSGFTFKLLSANPSDRDALGSNAADSSHEYGATVAYSNSNLRGQIGYLTRERDNLAGKSANRTLTDVLLGTTLGKFNLDLQYSIVSDPSKNTLTAAATDEEDDGYGAMALASYQVTEKSKIGLRYEILKDDPIGGGYQEAESYGANLHHQLHQNLALRVEGVKVDITESATKFDEHRFSIGGLLVF